MKCQELHKDLVGFAEGDLNDVRAEVIRTHLASCSGCRAEVRSIQATLELASLFRVPEMPKGAGVRILVGLRERLTRRRPEGVYRWLPAAGSAVLVGGILLLAQGLWRAPVEAPVPRLPGAGSFSGGVEMLASISEDSEMFERVLQQLAGLEGSGGSPGGGTGQDGRTAANPQRGKGVWPAPPEANALLREYQRRGVHEDSAEALLRDLSDEEFDQVIQKVEEGLSV